MEKNIGNFNFNTQKLLGKGSYSCVYQGYHKTTGDVVALKIVNRYLLQLQVNIDLIMGEISIMKQISHQNIIKMLEVYQTKNNIYLVLEFCNQGDLMGLIRKGPIQEEIAFKIFQQIVQGYSYLYSNGIMHRDLKPANIFMNNGVVKIADFGFALKTKQNDQIKTQLAGTPANSSPQMLQNQYYSYLNDMWSLGILLYEMVQGHNPWPNAQNQQELLRNMAQKNIQFTRKQIYLQRISQFCKDIILNLLQYDECQRMNLESLQNALNLKFGCNINQNIPQQQINKQNIIIPNQPQDVQLQKNIIINENQKEAIIFDQQNILQNEPDILQNNKVPNLIKQQQQEDIQQQQFINEEFYDYDNSLLIQIYDIKYAIKLLDFDPSNITLEYVLQKLLVIIGQNNSQLKGLSQIIKNQIDFENFISNQKNQEILNDFFDSYNEIPHDFNLNFTLFATKNLNQHVRKFNHYVSKKQTPNLNDLKIIQILQKLLNLAESLKNIKNDIQNPIKNDIIYIDFENFNNFVEVRQRVLQSAN